MRTDPLLRLEGIGKRFGGVRAVKAVDMTIEAGTIHGLVGENGAGKSTLGNIIGGALRPDEGTLRLDGAPVRYRGPRAALDDGIVLMAQELELVPDLTVEQNVLLGFESRKIGVIDRGEMTRRFSRLSEITDFDLRADQHVGSLPPADQQKVEIMRAVARDARLIVMDEPTSSLTRDQVEKLHEVARRLRINGTTIIYVSHFLEEIIELCDQVTVMRNGEHIQTTPVEGQDPDSLVTAMLGQATKMTVTEREPVPQNAPIALSTEKLTKAGQFSDVSLSVREGEILGVAGLVGSGRSELARALFGDIRTDDGVIRICGQEKRFRSAGEAVRAGVALVPPSRKEQGLVMGLPVGTNVTLPHGDTVSTLGVLDRSKENLRVLELLKKLETTPADTRLKVELLSGGNQQKVLFAKWLFREPRVIILDEPTRGVDVGARRTIYDLIISLSRSGMAVILISSELEELMTLSHRIAVMRVGRLVTTFDACDFSEERIMQAAFSARESSQQPKEEQE